MNASIKIGNIGEKAVIDCLKNNGIECKKNEDVKTRADYDIIFELDKKQHTIEVKYDRMAATTGNICIEYQNSATEKDSGIAATKADLWAHIIQDGSNNVIFITSVKRLRKFIADNVPHKQFTKAGDNNSSFYLYKENVILDSIFQRIDIIPKENVVKLIKKLLKEKV